MRMKTPVKRTLGRVVALLLLIVPAGAARAQQGWATTKGEAAGKDLNTVYFADQKRGWVAGDGGFVSRTTDGGLTWGAQMVATQDAINDIYFRNKDDGYLLAGNSI